MFWARAAIWHRLILVGIVQSLVVFGLLVPRVFVVMQGPVKEAALLARAIDAPTFVYRTSMPSFSVYRDAITPELTDPQAGKLVFLRVDKLDRLRADVGDYRLIPIYQRGAVALVRIAGGENG